MKYKLYYAYYPFEVTSVHPEVEEVEASSLTEAIDKLKDLKGRGAIEVFESPARKFYNEPA